MSKTDQKEARQVTFDVVCLSFSKKLNLICPFASIKVNVSNKKGK
jgi:hypothetical protein